MTPTVLKRLLRQAEKALIRVCCEGYPRPVREDAMEVLQEIAKQKKKHKEQGKPLT